MTTNISCSTRFLDAFNQIEWYLRRSLDVGTEVSFARLILGSVDHGNTVVKRFRADLQAYAKLRNAIVHQKRAIAEPHADVCGRIERIAGLLMDPPRVDSKFSGEVVTVSRADGINKPLSVASELGYSQFPVLEPDGEIRGLLTASTITRWLGRTIEEDLISLRETTVAVVMEHEHQPARFEIIPRDSSVFQAASMFEEAALSGPPLEALLINHNGSPSARLLGIMTAWDLPAAFSLMAGNQG